MKVFFKHLRGVYLFQQIDITHFIAQKKHWSNFWLNSLCVSVCIQSDDTDGTAANEDEVLHQQPNNTRATGTGSKQNPRELSLSSKAR